MKLKQKQIEAMIKEAKRVRRFAFAHRSNHKIGAAVLTAGERIYGGCNIESVISGLGSCAERVAIDHAVVNGHYRIKAICVVDKHLTPSCGACLQYALLFSQLTKKEIWIIQANLRGYYKVHALSTLLPEGYQTGNHLKKIRSVRESVGQS